MVIRFQPDLTKSQQHGIGVAGRPDSIAETRDHIEGLVAKLWSKECGLSSLNANQQWSKAGGDSLKALSLILELETAVGLAVPFDVLEDITTPNDLVNNLRRLMRDEKDISSTASSIGVKRRPLIVLAPGIGGDEPALARMRSHLDAQFRFLVLRYPNARDLVAAGASFEAIIRYAAAQLDKAVQKDEPIHLLGYSFGGFVAWRLSELLEREGQAISGVGLIDSYKRPRRQLHGTHSFTGPHDLFKNTRRMIKRTLWSTAHNFIMSGPIIALKPVLFLLEKLPDRAGSGRALAIKKIEIRLLSRSLDDFIPMPLQSRVVFFRSSERTGGEQDFEWSNLSKHFDLDIVEGSHLSILGPSRCHLLSQKIANRFTAQVIAKFLD
jgi:thioesterase domain-containing protein/acyl carrier protein